MSVELRTGGRGAPGRPDASRPQAPPGARRRHAARPQRHRDGRVR